MSRRALLALGAAAATALSGLWSGATSAAPPREAISRRSVLGGAEYLIEVPPGWRGGLVVYAQGIQGGPGPGAVTAPPLANHIVGGGTRGRGRRPPCRARRAGARRR